MNAACGPYIIACTTSAAVIAQAIATGDPVSSSGKKMKATTNAHSTPAPYTARRPKTSDSEPKIGIVTALQAPPMERATSANVRETPTVAVRYDSEKVAASEYSTSGPIRAPPPIRSLGQ